MDGYCINTNLLEPHLPKESLTETEETITLVLWISVDLLDIRMLSVNYGAFTVTTCKLKVLQWSGFTMIWTQAQEAASMVVQIL